MFTFLLIVQALVAAALVGTILMQRSEGGGLGVGGSLSGFMTARGAADFLTRSTAILGGVFIVLSIVMAAIAGVSRTPAKIEDFACQPGGSGDAAGGAGPPIPTPLRPPPAQPDRPGGSAGPISPGRSSPAFFFAGACPSG